MTSPQLDPAQWPAPTPSSALTPAEPRVATGYIPQPVPAASQQAAGAIAPYIQLPALQPSRTPVGKRRGAWSVWWLCSLTFGIYYLVWYAKINNELRRFAPDEVRVNSTLAWLSQLVPIAGLVSLANTGKRLNAAAYALGSPIRVSPAICWLSAFWFSSHIRYIQRRLDGLWDAAQTAARHVR